MDDCVTFIAIVVSLESHYIRILLGFDVKTIDVAVVVADEVITSALSYGVTAKCHNVSEASLSELLSIEVVEATCVFAVDGFGDFIHFASHNGGGLEG